MKVSTFVDEDQLVAKAVDILVDGLGPVEAGRFLTLPRERRLESVQRHRQWQSTLDKNAFFDTVFSSPDAPSVRSANGAHCGRG